MGRRFLLHVLPSGFHRIRHYGLLANPVREENLRRARELLLDTPPVAEPLAEDPGTGTDSTTSPSTPYICPACGAPMIVIETFERGQLPRAPPGAAAS